MQLTLRLLLLATLATFTMAAAPAKFTPHSFKASDGTIVDAELGELRVPENRAKSDSRMLTLRFVRFQSTAKNPGPPIIYLAGGPGGAGTAAAAGARFPLFMALREFGDVIAYDARGVSRSEPDSRCTEEYSLDPGAPLSRDTYGAAFADAARRCADRLRKAGVDPSALNTRESAADLNDLRLALGAKKVTLWGISYGTHLGVAMLRAYPEAVDRVILAGIEGPDETYKLPSDQQSLLEDIARLAHRQGISADLLGSIARLLDELEARPKRVSLTHPENGMSAPFVFGKLDLQRVLAEMLTGPESFAAMPAFVARLEQGDWTSLALAAVPQRFGRVPSMMSIAMDCASGITPARRQRIAEESRTTLLGDAINLPFPEVCHDLDIADLGDAYRAPLTSEVPALLISGTLDGRTRPRQAEELRRRMPNAVTLTIEGAGHSDPLFLSSPKILDAMKTFLRGETVRERVIALPPIAFDAHRPVVALSDDVLTRYAGSYRLAPSMAVRITKAGSLLYAKIGESEAFPIRPTSETAFFATDAPATLRFEVVDGRAVALFFGWGGAPEQRAAKE